MQCINNKLLELELFLKNTNCDIFCVSESWAKKDQLRSLNINGYCLGSYYCRETFKNGGVCIFVKNSLNYVNLDYVSNLSVEKDFECSAIKCTVKENEYFIILTLYRSPDGNVSIFFDKLNIALNLLIKNHRKHNIIICGDFNINFLLPSKNRTDLLDIFNSYCIIPTIKEFTRVKSCIDNICVNLNEELYESSVINNGVSDHNAQIISVQIKNDINNKKRVIYRELNNPDNVRYFCNLLKNENWDNILNSTCDVNTKFGIFCDTFLYHFEIAFPVKTKTIKHNEMSTKKWITHGLKISSKKLKELYALTLNGDEEIKSYYKKYKSIYRQLLKKAKKMYNNSLLANTKNKSKMAWNIIRSNNNDNKNRHEILLDVNNVLTNDSNVVSNHLNKYFNDVPNLVLSKVSQNNSQEIRIKENPFSFFIEPATEFEVLSIVKNLKNSNSCGEDNISTNLLKKCIMPILKPLTELLNCSLSEGIFPEKLKVAKIVPLYKSGCMSKVENYRPISILSSFSKIFEKYVAQKIVKFFDKHKLFNSNQFGFRTGLSTTTAITQFLNNLYESLDTGKKCVGIFLDLSKAFDLVCHSRLIKKLEKYGVRGQPLKWFKSYLCDRAHFVQINNAKSDVLETSIGVPQGSVLGPLLYIIFVNDFSLDGSLLFADDSSFLISNSKIEHTINEANLKISQAHEWFTENNLVLNNNKSTFLRFSNLKENYQESLLIKTKNGTIRQEQTLKFLGLYISDNCSWSIHIDNICKRVAPVCYCINQLRDVVDRSVLIMYYYAHFHSVISYAIIAWGAASDSVRVFKMQKRALRFIFGLNKRESCRNLFKQLGILTLPCILLLNLLVYAKTELNTNTLNSHHMYNTRNGTTLEIPLHRLAKYKQSPKYLAIKVYNHLPDRYKNLQLKCFKLELKKILINKCYYSLNEYHADNSL